MRRAPGPRAEPHATSEVAEIRVDPHHQFYDFEAKYLPEENTALDVPADVEPGVAADIRAAAVRAFDALDCEGLARVDFFLFPDGRIILNEVETMPGFTARRCSPGCGRPAGWTTPSSSTA